MWSLLTKPAGQVEWRGQFLMSEEWKDALTATLKRRKVVPGIDGGFVALETSMRRMVKPEMLELIGFIYAFGAGQGVRFYDDERMVA